MLALLTGLSRSEANEIIASGAVSVERQGHREVVDAGRSTDNDWWRCCRRRESTDVEADASVPVDVVLDDADFAVVNKAPGQVVHPGAGHRDGTLVAGLLALYPQMRAAQRRGSL